jgi:predicted membrane-bound spermidine synthase
VPSFFGVWGFSLARPRHGSLSEEAPPLPTSIPRELLEPDGTPARLRFLTEELMRTLFVFPQDLAEVDVEVNRLDNQVVVQYHEGEWRRFVR